MQRAVDKYVDIMLQGLVDIETKFEFSAGKFEINVNVKREAIMFSYASSSTQHTMSRPR